MTLRLRYTGTELCPEGVVEVVREANAYRMCPSESGNGDHMDLLHDYTDDEGGRKFRVVGTVAAGRWQSIVNLDDEVVEA
jgi:hypothetical protein